jgi:glycosyltransferase involved in cell wall biosynthesis
MTGNALFAPGVPLSARQFGQSDPVMVSICCITFNHSPYLVKCLDGFLEQTCDFRVEIVIYDDASTDGTADIIREYAARHPTIFRPMLMTDNQYSKGVNPYFAYVFPEARGRYIAICDGDDYWTDPLKLARQVAVLEAEPAIALTFGPVRGVDEVGQEIPYTGGVEHDLTAEELKAAPPINTLTSCFRNIYQGSVAHLYIRMATIGDLMVWGMLGYHGGARFLPDLAAASYRLREGGLISMQSKERQLLMTAIARMHLACYHAEQNDLAAMDTVMLAAVEHFNANDKGVLVYSPRTALSPGMRLTRWRKSLTRWRKSVRRRIGHP